MAYFARDFANVDGTESAAGLIACLDLQCSLQFYQDYKRKTFELLQPFEGASLLEVGCGTGEDAIALAQQTGSTGKVIAIDRSQSMIEQARVKASGLNLSLEFWRADARHLPFDDNSFHGARVDRTLQHIDDAGMVITEMARVLRSDGLLVAMEPDWETFTVNSPDREITRHLLNFWCDSFPSGWIGRNLTKYFRQARLREIQVYPETFVTTDLTLADRIFDLTGTVARAQGEGKISSPAAADWWDELSSLHRAGMFFASFTAMIVKGKK
jgi:ubiquinone/menaquinone biosynthesis C-methylase UbiE